MRASTASRSGFVVSAHAALFLSDRSPARACEGGGGGGLKELV